MAIRLLFQRSLLVLAALIFVVAPAQSVFAGACDNNSACVDTEWYTGTLASQCSAVSDTATAGTGTTAATTTTSVTYGSAAKKAALPKNITEITKTSSTDTNATSINAKIAYQYFSGLGLSTIAVGGILGNMSWESHFRADNASERNWPAGGYGLSQWTGGRRTTLVKNMTIAGIGDLYNEAWDAGKVGKTPPDKAGILLGFELDYVWWELHHGYKTTLSEINSATSIDDAVTKYFHSYEGIDDWTLSKRIALGKKWVSQFSGVAIPTVGDTSGAGPTCATGDQTSDTQPSEKFIYYSQNDAKWASVAFNYSTIKSSGCGATSYAMAVANLNNDTTVTPATIANWSRPFWDSFGYVGEVLADRGEKQYGIQSQKLGQDMSKIVAALKAGKWVIISGNGPKPFYNNKSGHIVLAHGITADGQLIIADPERGANDKYPASAIAPYIKYSVAVYK